MAMKRRLGQLDLFPRPAYRPQSLADLDAIGEKLVGEALAFHAAFADDPRATRACYSALIIFGAIEVLRRRGHR
jgi:hypothetical protein